MFNLPKWALLTALLAASVAASVGLAFASGDGAADTLDAVICPQSGEEIARDDCPLIDTTRSDCPGKIECPLTGELVCRDRCPLEPKAVCGETRAVCGETDE